MKYLQFDDDICIAASDIPRTGFIENPKHIPMEYARMQNDTIIDAAHHSTFYVDELGLRHITPGKGRQTIDCDLLEPLIIDNQTFMKESYDPEDTNL